MRGCEQLGHGGVAGLGIEDDHVVSHIAQGDKCFPVRLPRRHHRARLVARQRHVCRPAASRSGASCRGSGRNTRSGDRAEHREDCVGIGQRTAVHAFAARDCAEPFALLGTGDDRQWPGRVVIGRCEGVVDGQQVVPVDLEGPPAEGPGPTGVGTGVTVRHRRPALPQAVDVHDDHEVAEAVVGGVLERLPDRAFSHLAVAAEHEDPGWTALEPTQRQCDADGGRDALAQVSRWQRRPRAGSGEDDLRACSPELRGSAARRRRSRPWP